MSKKLRTIRIQRELLEAVKMAIKTEGYSSISKFVSEAIQIRLDALKSSHGRIFEIPTEYPIIHERLHYTPNHTWAMVMPKGNIRVGLSDHAQRNLAVISLAKIPVRSDVTQGKPFGVIETWMFTFDLYSPVSGKIVKINETIQEDPMKMINKDSYAGRWIIEIKPDNLITLEEELRSLMNPRQYEKFLTHRGT